MDLPPEPGAGPEQTGEQQEQHEVLERDRPKIYVASLSDYNAGVLHGEWIDADQEPEELHEAVTEMLARSPTDVHAEEFAIHDYEGFGRYMPEEYDSLEWISNVALGVKEKGPAFTAWAARCNRDEEALAKFEDVFLGEWESVEAFAEEMIDDLGIIDAIDRVTPEALSGYVHVDIAGFARDLELSSYVTAVTCDGGVWIFEGSL